MNESQTTDFHSARYWAREIWRPALVAGAVAVDATMGNGHDTEYLADSVGEAGRVYAFDVQPQALANTRARLEARRLLSRVTLFLQGHERMADFVPESVDLVAFNLGWLPGAPREITTRTDNTLLAVHAALTILKPGGIMTVCVYPGHEEGQREREALYAWAARLDPRLYDAMARAYLNQPNDPPCLIAVRRR